MFVSDLRVEFCKEGEGLDVLDFYLNLRALVQEEENLVERSSTEVDTRSVGAVGALFGARERRSTVLLTQAGWDWVRKSRSTEKLASILAGTIPLRGRPTGLQPSRSVGDRPDWKS